MGRDWHSRHYVPREERKAGEDVANPYALTAARLDAASLDGIPQGWSEVLSARGMVAQKVVCTRILRPNWYWTKTD